MNALIVLVVLLGFLLVGSSAAFIDGEDPTIPSISQDFTCQTEEVDKDGNTVVEQLLVWSATSRRSLMSAKGSLVHGYMEQIKRCDLIPEAGWFTNAGGPRGGGETWQCTNTSIPAKAEIPSHCVYNNFWEITSKETPRYIGVENIKGQECDRWDYDSENPNTGGIMKMSFWAKHDAPGRESPIATPCATGEAGVWTLYVSNFVAGEPPLDKFAPTADYSCPPASEDEGLEGTAPTNMETVGKL